MLYASSRRITAASLLSHIARIWPMREIRLPIKTLCQHILWAFTFMTNCVAATQFIGSNTCATCHAEAYKQWQASHHNLAMQLATPQTVLGDFNNKEFEYFGIRSTFSQQNNLYFVTTDGPDGELEKYQIAYTFGFYPLQQYLIAFPRGRYQVLNIAWDTRPTSEGGQKWFHLYPTEFVDHTHPFHWTGNFFTWNSMCADCHSTQLQKHYNFSDDTYNTSWSEMNVGCEACHGPGHQHVQWAQTKNPDLNASFSPSNKTSFANFGLDATPKGAMQLEICARCHARRNTIKHSNSESNKFLQNFQPALLDENLYYADGQIQDEVFVYGSFIQSKMFHQGVICSNCHEPHNMQLKLQGNTVCTQCHTVKTYDTSQHHLHPPQSSGALCVNCHMPETLYMQVDLRRDHSIRVPRPDLSDKIGSPNPCTQCHSEKSNQWAATLLAKKFGQPSQHYGEVLSAGRQRRPQAHQALTTLLSNTQMPAIVRGTAATLLPPYIDSPDVMQRLQQSSQDAEPLVRYGVARALLNLPGNLRIPLATPLLTDEIPFIQHLAATSIQDAPPEILSAHIKMARDQALNSYSETLINNSDHPESLLALAQQANALQYPMKALNYYKLALEQAPFIATPYLNFADYYRQLERDDLGIAILKQGLVKVQTVAPLHHALGLALVRRKKTREALQHLALSTNTPGSEAYFHYVYAIALHSNAQTAPAISVLKEGLKQFPNNRTLLTGLVSIYRDAGNTALAAAYEKQLEALQ